MHNKHKHLVMHNRHKCFDFNTTNMICTTFLKKQVLENMQNTHKWDQIKNKIKYVNNKKSMNI